MTVTPLDALPSSAPGPEGRVPGVPFGGDLDAPIPPAGGLGAASEAVRGSFGSALLGALDAASNLLGRADAAERAFAHGRGGLQEMVLERAQADVMLSVASAAASRAAQALTTLLGMQV